jgi:hypothetical protein
MLDRSKMMTQMKGDTLVLQVGGCVRLITSSSKKQMLRKPKRCL